MSVLLFLERGIKMKCLIAAGGILVFLLLFGLYCCIVVAAREDRLLEELGGKADRMQAGKTDKENMRRISPRIVLTVTSGIAGNGNVQRNAVIIFAGRTAG